MKTTISTLTKTIPLLSKQFLENLDAMEREIYEKNDEARSRGISFSERKTFFERLEKINAWKKRIKNATPRPIKEWRRDEDYGKIAAYPQSFCRMYYDVIMNFQNA